MVKSYREPGVWQKMRHFRLVQKCLRFFVLFSVLSSVFCLLPSQAQANNIAVSSVSLQNLDSVAGTVDIKFDVSWENSFTRTDSNGQAYFDRAWVFVKYQLNGTGAWGHATLVSGGSVGAYSTSTGTGVTTDGKGAFCKPGLNQTLRWSFPYGASMDTVKVRVFAIEMVYIPQGAFSVGDGNTSTVTGQLSMTGTTTPFNIASEGAITLGPGTGALGNRSHSGMAAPVDDFTDAAAPTASPTNLPAAFPKGYNGFYIMKYDISQGQYRDFLNTLTYTQQATRTANAPNSAAGTGALVTAVTYRNGLKIKTAGVASTTPAVYGCDLNGDGIYDGSNDGEWIACNYLSWADQCAYADWAGLRPMTELEFEKACRGTIAPVNGEYAWGASDSPVATANYFSDLSSSSGTDDATHSYANEVIGPTRPTANCNYSPASPQGPVRCGMFATSSSTRTQAGASYYGVMELSGNLWKRPVTIGQATGRAFTGLNGDGALDSTGNANVTGWPGTDATGAGYRGGDWNYGTSYSRVSDRFSAAYVYSGRSVDSGGRCVRTSP